jgi:hypothetical protein
MNSHTPTLPETLKTAAATETRRYKFNTAVADCVALPLELHGILAVKLWKLSPGLFLESMYQPRRYPSGFIWADQLPQPSNRNGIYAYPLADFASATAAFVPGHVVAIVELAGRVIEHANGVYRAECCRVLQFFAHTSLVARLSRIYGVPCVIADCGHEGNRKMVNWLSGHDGIRCLQWNLQFPADLQAERLLAGVETLPGDYSRPEEDDDIPEDQKDRGGFVSQYSAGAKLDCRLGGIVIRNTAIESKYPGGMDAFTFKHKCTCNNKFTLVKDEAQGMLAAALADMADYGVPWHDLVDLGRWGSLIPELTKILKEKNNEYARSYTG